MYEALFEDEDNIFGGSPRSKYMDIIYNANRNLVEGQLEQQLKTIAAMEHLLEEKMGPDFHKEVRNFIWSNEAFIDEKVKSLYIEYTGDILSHNE